MRLKTLHSPVLKTAALAGLLGAVGCGNAADDGVGQEREPIINGTNVSTDVIGTPYLTMTNGPSPRYCTGTVIRSDWVLTAHHCVSQNSERIGGNPIQPSQFTAHILNGNNTPSGTLIVRHPTLDVALVKMNAAPTGPSLATYPNWF